MTGPPGGSPYAPPYGSRSQPADGVQWYDSYLQRRRWVQRRPGRNTGETL